MGQTQSDEEEPTPEPGDIIEFPRLLYNHYGVAVDKEHVIHLTSPEEGGCCHNSSANGLIAEVKMEKISDVAWNRTYRISNMYDKVHVPKSQEKIVRVAMAMVGQKKNYDLLKSNCEHFATFMRYGVHESKQWSWWNLHAPGVLADQGFWEVKSKNIWNAKADDGTLIIGSALGAVALGGALACGVEIYKALEQKQPDQEADDGTLITGSTLGAVALGGVLASGAVLYKALEQKQPDQEAGNGTLITGSTLGAVALGGVLASGAVLYKALEQKQPDQEEKGFY